MKYKKQYLFCKRHKRFSEQYCMSISRFSSLVLLVPTLLLLVNWFIPSVAGGCREQEHDECETICKWNATLRQNECYLRAAVILPSNTNVEASLPRVSKAIEMEFQKSTPKKLPI